MHTDVGADERAVQHKTEQQQLVKMINQISTNNVSLGDDAAVADFVANHIDKFWSRRMKQILMELLEQGAELSPASKLAAEQVRDKAPA